MQTFALKLDSADDTTKLPHNAASEFWAGAIPASSVETGRVVALICPVSSRIEPSRPGPRLYGVLVYCHTSDAEKIRRNFTGKLQVIACELEDMPPSN